MRFIVQHATDRRNVYNIGPEGEGTQRRLHRRADRRPHFCRVHRIAYTGGDRGWVGDVPRFRYSTERLARLGWRPGLTSDEAVLRAIDEIASVFPR